MAVEIICGDITVIQADAIVNAANSVLAPGGGVCGAIFRAAGHKELDRACRAIGHCDVGQAVITDGFALPARYIIHTVGPVWRGGGQSEAELLRSCYIQSLCLAERHGCRSIAFPLISAGIFGYPKEAAWQVAAGAVREFLKGHDMRVILTAFDHETALLGQKVLERE